MNLVILQQVNQITQLAVVSAVSYRLLIGREFLLASSAQGRFLPRVGLDQRFAAGFASWAGDGRDGRDAGFANRQARNVREWLTAQAAICRENGGKKRSREGAGSRNR